KSAPNIDKTVAAHHELPRKLSGLQRRCNVEEPVFITVNLVREATLQSLARVVQPLLRVAQPVQQLAHKHARATIDPPVKIDNIGYNQFRRSARCRRAQIRDEIPNRKIDFVTYRRDNWHHGIEYCSCDDLFIELP